MIGSVLVDRYQVVQPLGEGATSTVYLVDDLSEHRRAAIKLFTGDLTDRTIEGRFKREVRAAQRLSHENIVRTFDCGRLPDGRLYLTMEAVSGTPLDALLRQRGPLPIPRALAIVAEVADALHHAAEHDVVHRDIKPNNIVLAPHPRGAIVKVLDFGLAKILAPDAKDSQVLTRDGLAFGSPAYMSPEQWGTQPPDVRTDIYALGCVAYELLTGQPPFTGKPIQLATAHLGKQPASPSSIDPSAGIMPALDRLVLRCLAKDPAARFQTGAQLAAAVRNLPEHRPLRNP
ncbi:MAG TPA: serine/threonine-protein kinase [Kofleriaceae bacterium]|nr:serine/threonine-protein kinase [Kofleriaceae bacterium]